MPLKRRLNLALVTFYGLGGIIGAGIYVLLGEVAALAGNGMGLAFLLAGLIAGLTGISYAELSSRYPKSAGSILFVDVAFNQPWLSRATAVAMLGVSAISSAVIAHGFVGYLQLYVDWSQTFSLCALALLIFVVGSLNIKGSVSIVAVITLIEIGGLLIVCAIASELPQRAPITAIVDVSVGLTPLVAAAFLAFYAFIGFEDMVNVAEEAIDPERTMPRGVLLAVIGSSLLYFLVSVVAILFTDLAELSRSSSPLATMVGHRPEVMKLVGLISLVAILNGAIVQVIMASRVLYGMAERGLAPGFFGALNKFTHTPVRNTFIATAVLLLLALSFQLVELANVTSALMLMIFVLVNLSLIKIKRVKGANRHGFNAPMIFPVAALLTTLVLLIYQLWSNL